MNRSLASKTQEAAMNKDLEARTSLLTGEMNCLGNWNKKINDVHAQEIKLDGQMDLDNRQIRVYRKSIGRIRHNSEKLRNESKQLIERCPPSRRGEAEAGIGRYSGHLAI